MSKKDAFEIFNKSSDFYNELLKITILPQPFLNVISKRSIMYLWARGQKQKNHLVTVKTRRLV